MKVELEGRVFRVEKKKTKNNEPLLALTVSETKFYQIPLYKEEARKYSYLKEKDKILVEGFAMQNIYTGRDGKKKAGMEIKPINISVIEEKKKELSEDIPW